jgi:corticosteroid 11-beta-dehydrogenase isozyme 1
VGLPFTTGYAGSKHALHGFFNSLRHDLILDQVRSRNGPVAITMCVLGNIDTASNRAATTGLVSDFLVRNPVADAASAIIQGGLKRRREIYYPWHEISPVITLDFFFPEWTATLVRRLSVK